MFKNSHYVIAGYGRIGKKLSEILLEKGAKVTCFDPGFESLDINHPNFNFFQADGSDKRDLVNVGFPNDVKGLILVAGTFAANASILFNTENYFPWSEYPNKDYVICIRARNAEEKAIFMQYASKTSEKLYVIYSEEAGANAVAAELGILIHNKENAILHELIIPSNGNSMSLFIELTNYFENHNIDVLNETYDHDLATETSKYIVVLKNFSKNHREVIRKKLTSLKVDYTLSQISDDSRFTDEKVLSYGF